MSSCSSSSRCDQRGRGGRVVGRVAVGHHIDVGLDVGEHAADDIALALHPLGADDRARDAGIVDGAVAAVVVVDVDRRAGQRRAEGGDRLRDRRLLVVAGQDHGDAGGGRGLVERRPPSQPPFALSVSRRAGRERRACSMSFDGAQDERGIGIRFGQASVFLAAAFLAAGFLAGSASASASRRPSWRRASWRQPRRSTATGSAAFFGLLRPWASAPRSAGSSA